MAKSSADELITKAERTIIGYHLIVSEKSVCDRDHQERSRSHLYSDRDLPSLRVSDCSSSQLYPGTRDGKPLPDGSVSSGSFNSAGALTIIRSEERGNLSTQVAPGLR